jgi:hypothetical protein
MPLLLQFVTRQTVQVHAKGRSSAHKAAPCKGAAAQVKQHCRSRSARTLGLEQGVGDCADARHRLGQRHERVAQLAQQQLAHLPAHLRH